MGACRYGGFRLRRPAARPSLAAIAAWRAAQLPWWGPLPVIAGMATFIGFDATLPGNVLLTVAFAIFAAALTRIDPDVWQSPGTLPAIRAASP